MTKQKQRITKRLQEIGAGWFTTMDKFCDPNDPMQNKLDNRKTYHIHPNLDNPRIENVLRFDSLRGIEEWIRSRNR